MENNSEKEGFRNNEEKLEHIASELEQDIDKLKELEHREEDILEEVKDELGHVEIFVNGTPEKVKKGEITYDQVVTFAFPDFPQHPERNYSVKYKGGHGEKPEGILSPGGKVKVHDKMKFNVTYTGQS